MTGNSSNDKNNCRITIQAFLRELRILFSLVLVAIAVWLVARQLQQDAGVRELVAIVSRQPESEQLNPIACSHVPLGDGPDRAALEDAVLRLAQPAQRALTYCLLGDYPSALAAYEQSASKGDNESVLQAYFLRARQGDLESATRAVSGIHFSVNEIQDFFTAVIRAKINIDLLPLAQHMAGLYPGAPDIWKLWLDAARGYERASNWQRALDAYLEAIQVQEKVGVSIGRSSFELGAGRIAQTRLEPRDLNRALNYYNSVIADMDFIEPANSSYVFIYRGEVYRGLRPVYTTAQVLQEFIHSLELDPKNYWAALAIAGVYLWDLKDYSLAEQYSNQAIGLNAQLPDAYLTRGDIYRQQSDMMAAAAAYEEALAHRPGWQIALDRLAAVQAELQKRAP